MIFLPFIILIGFNLVNVFIDAYKIAALHKTIRHGINLSAYVLCAGFCIWIFKIHLWESVVYLFAACFLRFALFNPLLSLRRKLKWDYVSKERKAWADRLLYRLYGMDGRKPVVHSALLFIIFTVIYFVW